MITLGPDTGDARERIQQALVQDDVRLRNGEYRVTVAPGTYLALTLRGRSLTGESRDGVRVVLEDGQHPSARVLGMSGEGARLERLTVDGNQGGQEPDPLGRRQRHAVWVDRDAMSPVIRNVVATNARGDGIAVYSGVSDLTVDRCLIAGNGRNGLSWVATHSPIDRPRVMRSVFRENGTQHIDSEPGGVGIVRGLVVEQCDIGPVPAAIGYGITTAGPNSATLNRDWEIRNCRLESPIQPIWIDGLTVRGCRWENIREDIQRACVEGWRTSHNVLVEHCVMESPRVGVSIISTAGDQADDWRVEGCEIAAGAHGVSMQGARSLRVSDSRIVAGKYGVWARSTFRADDYRVTGCRMVCERGVGAYSWGYERFGLVEIDRNAITASALEIRYEHGIIDDLRLGWTSRV